MFKMFYKFRFFLMLLSVLVIGAFGVNFRAQAMIAPQVYFTDVNISQTSFQPGETISGVVTLWNYENFPLNDLKLHFQLLGREVNGVPTEIINEQIGKETFSLQPGIKTSRNFVYQLPTNLPKGDFKFRIQLTNSRGEEMSWIDKVINVGGEGKFLFLDNYWFEKDGQQLAPGGGIEYQPGETGQIVFDVQNESNFTISAFYKIITYKRNIGGEKLKEVKGKSVILAPQEKRTIKVSLPLLETPGTYLSEVKFFDYQTQQEISNSISFRWIIAGEDSAQILFVNPNQSSYQAGEEATVKVQYAGPAHETGQTAQKGIVKVGLYDVNGNLLGEKQENITLKVGEKSLKVPITQSGKIARIDTSLLKGNKVLDQYNQEIQKTIQPPKQTFLEKYEISLIVAIIILLLVIIYFWRHKKAEKRTLILLLFVLVSMIFSAGYALAATEVTGGCCDTTIIFNSPYPNQTYNLGDTIKFSGKFRVTSCGDGLFFNKVTFYITEDQNIPLTDDCGQSTTDCSKSCHCGCSSLGCHNCYGGKSTAYSSCNIKWCDQVKYLDINRANQLGYKVYKLGEIYPGDVHAGARPYWVEYNKSFVIPEDLEFSGPARFYVQYSGTHWHGHWHWNVAYQKGNIQVNHSPQSQIQCDPSNCKTYYLSSPLTLRNVSYDPDGDEDIVKTRWYTKLRGAADSTYQLVTYCQGDKKTDCTLQLDVKPQQYTAKLYIEDSTGRSSTATKNFRILKDIEPGFMCSLDQVTWEDCESLSNSVFQDQLLYLKDDASLETHSIPSEDATLTTRVWKFNSNIVANNKKTVVVRLKNTTNIISLITTDNQGRTGVASYTLIARPIKWQEKPPTD